MAPHTFKSLNAIVSFGSLGRDAEREVLNNADEMVRQVLNDLPNNESRATEISDFVNSSWWVQYRGDIPIRLKVLKAVLGSISVDNVDANDLSIFLRDIVTKGTITADVLSAALRKYRELGTEGEALLNFLVAMTSNRSSGNFHHGEILGSISDAIRLPENATQQVQDYRTQDLFTLLNNCDALNEFNVGDLDRLVDIAYNSETTEKIRLALLRFILGHRKNDSTHRENIAKQYKEKIRSIDGRRQLLAEFQGRDHTYRESIRQDATFIGELLKSNSFSGLATIFKEEKKNRELISNNIDQIVRSIWSSGTFVASLLSFSESLSYQTSSQQNRPGNSDGSSSQQGAEDEAEKQFAQQLIEKAIQYAMNAMRNIGGVTDPEALQLFSVALKLETADADSISILANAYAQRRIHRSHIVEELNFLLALIKHPGTGIDAFNIAIARLESITQSLGSNPSVIRAQVKNQMSDFLQAVLESPHCNADNLQVVASNPYHSRENLETIVAKPLANATSTPKIMALFNTIIDSPNVSRQCIDDIFDHLDDIEDFTKRFQLFATIKFLKDEKLRRPKRDNQKYEIDRLLYNSFPTASSLNELMTFAKSSDANRKLLEENCDAIVCKTFFSIPLEQQAVRLQEFMEADIPTDEPSSALALMLLKSVVKNIGRENLTEFVLFRRLKNIIDYPLADTELIESAVDAYFGKKTYHPDSLNEQFDFMAKAAIALQAGEKYKNLSGQLIAELTKDDVDESLTPERSTSEPLGKEEAWLKRLMDFAGRNLYNKQFVASHIETIVDNLFRKIPGSRLQEFISNFIDSFKDSEESVLDLKQLILRQFAKSAGTGNIEKALVFPMLQHIFDHAVHDTEMLNAIGDAISTNNLHGSPAFQLLGAITQHPLAEETTIDIAIRNLTALTAQGHRSSAQYETDVLVPLTSFIEEVARADSFNGQHLNRMLEIATTAPLPSEPVRTILFEAIINDPRHTAEHIKSIFNLHLEEIESVERRVTLLRAIELSLFATEQHRDKLSQQISISLLISESKSFKELTDFAKGNDADGIEAIDRMDAIFNGIYSRLLDDERAIHLRRIIESELPIDRSNANAAKICELMLQKAAEKIERTDIESNELAETILRHPLAIIGSIELVLGKYAAWNSERDTLVFLADAHGLQSLTDAHRSKLLESFISIFTQAPLLTDADLYDDPSDELTNDKKFDEKIISYFRRSAALGKLILENMDSIVHDGLMNLPISNRLTLLYRVSDGISGADEFETSLRYGLLKNALRQTTENLALVDQVSDIHSHIILEGIGDAEILNACFDGYVAARKEGENALDVFIAAANHPFANEKIINTIVENIHLVLRTANAANDASRMLEKLPHLMMLITGSAYFKIDHLDALLRAARERNIPEDFKSILVNEVIDHPGCTEAHADVIVDELIITFTSPKTRLNLLEKTQKFRDDPERLVEARKAELIDRFAGVPAFIDFLTSTNRNNKDTTFAIKNVEAIFAGVFQKHQVGAAYNHHRINSQHDHSQLLMLLCEKISSISPFSRDLKRQLFNSVIKHVTQRNVKTRTNSLAILTQVINDRDVVTETINLIAGTGIRDLPDRSGTRPVISLLNSLIVHRQADSETIASVIAYACLENKVKGAEAQLLGFLDTVIDQEEYLKLGHLTALVQVINYTNLPTLDSRLAVLGRLRTRYTDKAQDELGELGDREHALEGRDGRLEARELALTHEEGIQLQQDDDETRSEIEEIKNERKAIQEELETIQRYRTRILETRNALTVMSIDEIRTQIMTGIPLEDLYAFARVSKDYANYLFRSLIPLVLNHLEITSDEQQKTAQHFEEIKGGQYNSSLSAETALAYLQNMHIQENVTGAPVEARQNLEEMRIWQPLTSAQIQTAEIDLEILQNEQDRRVRAVRSRLQDLLTQRNPWALQNGRAEQILRALQPVQFLKTITALRGLQSEGVLTPAQALGTINGIQEPIGITPNANQQLDTVVGILENLQTPSPEQQTLTTQQAEHAQQALQGLRAVQALLQLQAQGVLTQNEALETLRAQQGNSPLEILQGLIARQAKLVRLSALLNLVLDHPTCNDAGLYSVVNSAAILYQRNLISEGQLGEFVDKAINHDKIDAGTLVLVTTNAIFKLKTIPTEHRQALQTLEDIRALEGLQSQPLTAQIVLQSLQNIYGRQIIADGELALINQAQQTLQNTPPWHSNNLPQSMQAQEKALQILQRHQSREVQTAEWLLQGLLPRQNLTPPQRRQIELVLQAIQPLQFPQTLTALCALNTERILEPAEAQEIIRGIQDPRGLNAVIARIDAVRGILQARLASPPPPNQQALTVKQTEYATQALRGLEALRALLDLQNQNILIDSQPLQILRVQQGFLPLQALQGFIVQQSQRSWITRLMNSVLAHPRCDAEGLDSVLTTAGDLYVKNTIRWEQLVALIDTAINHDKANADTLNLTITNAFGFYPKPMGIDQLKSLVDTAVNHRNADFSVLNLVMTEVKGRHEDPDMAGLLTTVMNSQKANLPGGPVAAAIMQDIIDGTMKVADGKLIPFLSDTINSSYAQINTLDKLIEGIESGKLAVPQNELGPFLTTVVGRPYIDAELLNKIVLGVIEKIFSVADEHMTDVLIGAMNSSHADNITLNIIIDSLRNNKLSIPQNRLGEFLSAIVNSNPANTNLLNNVVSGVFKQSVNIVQEHVADFLLQAMDSQHADHTTVYTIVENIKSNPSVIPQNQLRDVLLAVLAKRFAGTALLNDVIENVVQQKIPLPEEHVADLLLQGMEGRHADHTTASTLLENIKSNPSVIPRNRLGEILLAAVNRDFADTALLNDVIKNVVQQKTPLPEEHVVDFLSSAMGSRHADRTTIFALVVNIKSNPSAIPQNRLTAVLSFAVNSKFANTELLNDVVLAVIRGNISVPKSHAADFLLGAMKTRHMDQTTLEIIVEGLKNNPSIVSPSSLDRLLTTAINHDDATSDVLNDVVEGVIQKTLPIPEDGVGSFLLMAIDRNRSRHADNRTLTIVLTGIETNSLPDASNKNSLLLAACGAPYADKRTLSMSIPLLFNPAIEITKHQTFNTLQELHQSSKEFSDADVINLTLENIYNAPHRMDAEDCLDLFSQMTQSHRHGAGPMKWVAKIIAEQKISFPRISHWQMTELTQVQNSLLDSRDLDSEIVGHVIKTMDHYRKSGSTFVGELFSKLIDDRNRMHIDQSHISQLLDLIPHCFSWDQKNHFEALMKHDGFEEIHARQIIRNVSVEHDYSLTSPQKTQLFTDLLDRHDPNNSLIKELLLCDTVPALLAAASSSKVTTATFESILDQLEKKVRSRVDFDSIPDVLGAITRHQDVAPHQFSKALKILNDIPGADKFAVLDEASQNPNIAQHLDSFFAQLGISDTTKPTLGIGREIAMDNSHSHGNSYVAYYERVARASGTPDKYLGTLLQLANKKNMQDPEDRFRLRVAVGLSENANVAQLEEVAEKVEEYIKDNAKTMQDKDRALDDLAVIKVKAIHNKIYPGRPMKIENISTESRDFDSVPLGITLAGKEKGQAERVGLLYAIQKENPSDNEPTHFYAVCRPIQIRNAENKQLKFTWGGIETNARTFSKGKGQPALQALIATLGSGSQSIQIRISPHNASQLDSSTMSHGLSSMSTGHH